MRTSAELNERSMYELETTADESIVGIYPQGSGMVKNYDFDSPVSVDRFSEYKGKECGFIPDLRYKLNREAKLTDFLSGCLGPGGDLVVSQKVYDLLTRFALGPHAFFEATVEHRKTAEKFYRLHFLYKLESKIEFSKSTFKYAGKKIPSIDSYSAYKQYSGEHDPFGLIRTTKTVVPLKTFGKFDLFVIGLYDQRVYISDRLRDEIRSRSFTGIDVHRSKTLSMV